MDNEQIRQEYRYPLIPWGTKTKRTYSMKRRRRVVHKLYKPGGVHRGKEGKKGCKFNSSEGAGIPETRPCSKSFPNISFISCTCTCSA